VLSDEQIVISLRATSVSGVFSKFREKPVRRALLATIFLMTFCIPVFAQHGSAGTGYFPLGYAGDTWSGEVVSSSDTTREITLTYTNGKKSETFTGVLIDNYRVKSQQDGSMIELKPSDIPKGARIIVFYQAKTKKANGNKVKYYEIFQLNTSK
jgi:hypothetical protein